MRHFRQKAYSFLVPTIAGLVSSSLLKAAESVPEVVVSPVTVSASRLDSPIVEQPYAYYRAEREDMDRANARSPVEALDHTPGVVVQKTAGNQASPYLRGLTGEQTLLMFDGVRLNQALNRSGPNQYSAMIPDSAVGAVDVLLGSSGSVQGSDGLTGTMDFVLARAGRGVTTAASPWVSVREHTADGQQVQVGVDGNVENFSYSIDGSRTWATDRRGGKDAGDHLFGSAAGDRDIPNSGYDQFDGGARVAYTGLTRNRFELSGGRTYQSDAPRADGYFENSGNASRIARYYDPQIFDYAHARHIFIGGEGAPRVQTTLYWHHNSEAQTQEDIQNQGTATQRYRRREWLDAVSTLGLDLQLTSIVADRHSVTYGTTIYRDQTSNSVQQYRSPAGNISSGAAVFDAANSSNGFTTVPDESSYDGMGFFVQDLWMLNDQWDVLVGGRWSRYAWKTDVTTDRAGYATYGNTTLQDHAQAVTGNARLGWHPMESSTIFTGISQGFRAPNLSNLTGIQSRGSSNIQVQGNPDLESEKSLTYEIGAKTEQQRDSASATFFYTALQDLMQTTYTDVNGDGAITAVDRAKIENANSGVLAGFELAHDWGIVPERLPGDQRVAVFNVVNATTGEADQENAQGQVTSVHISRANRVSGMGGVTWEPQPVWYVTCQTRWSMAYKEVNPGDATDTRHTTFQSVDGDRGSMPGFAVLDLKAGWKAGRNLRVDAALENLLNHSYREVGSGIDGAGLSGVLRITARY